MLKIRQAQTHRTWKQLERDYNLSDGLLRRMAQGEIGTYLQAKTLSALAEFLGVRPVVVVLAHAEELGYYDPDQDGLLNHAGLPHHLHEALATLHKELGVYLDDSRGSRGT